MGDFGRIYSINLASYLAAKNYKYKIEKDEEKENLCYFVFTENLEDEIKKYKSNAELQDFIRSYRDIKKQIHKS